MANEVMKAQEMLSAVEFSADGALQLRNLGEAFCVARLLIGAGFAPKGSTPESATVAIMHGKKLGLDAMTSVQSIAAVNGRPTLWGDAMVALVQASGLVEDEKVEWFPSHKDPQAVRYTVKRKGRPTPVVGEFSRLMAERAGLWGKQGPWKTNPDRMLLQRARTFALRDAFADVLKGMISTEEARDMVAEGRPLPESEDLKVLKTRKRAPAAALVAPVAPADVLAVPEAADAAGEQRTENGEQSAPTGDGVTPGEVLAVPPSMAQEAVSADGGDFLD